MPPANIFFCHFELVILASLHIWRSVPCLDKFIRKHSNLIGKRLNLFQERRAHCLTHLSKGIADGKFKTFYLKIFWKYLIFALRCHHDDRDVRSWEIAWRFVICQRDAQLCICQLHGCVFVNVNNCVFVNVHLRISKMQNSWFLICQVAHLQNIQTAVDASGIFRYEGLWNICERKSWNNLHIEFPSLAWNLAWSTKVATGESS